MSDEANGCEQWRSVPGFDGWYEVSSLGTVRSWRTHASRQLRARTPRSLKAWDSGQGYLRVRLIHPVLGQLYVAVHHLVLAAFVQERPAGLVCDHINADRSDNRVENLRWVTQPQNVAHAAELGRMNGRIGARSHSPLSPELVAEIRRLRAAGSKLRELASAFGVSISTISNIALGHSWREVAA